MTGLVLKDLLCLRKAFTSTLLVMGFYIVLALTGMWDLGFMAGFLCVMLTVLPINCFAYDSAAKWDVYARTLPLTPARAVCARYLTVLLLAAAGVLLSLAAGLVGAALGKMQDWGVYLATEAVCAAIALLLNAVMLPLLYKFGAERARILLYGVLAVLALLSFLAVRGLGGLEFLSALDEQAPPPPWLLGVPFVSALLLLGLSFPLSLYFYRKTEL